SYLLFFYLSFVKFLILLAFLIPLSNVPALPLSQSNKANFPTSFSQCLSNILASSFVIPYKVSIVLFFIVLHFLVLHLLLCKLLFDNLNAFLHLPCTPIHFSE